jgi:hypothetical protein
MIYDTIDQQQKDIQQQGTEQAYLEGMTDGSHGYPLRLKRMHDTAYIKGYVIGITKWAAELERREQENYADSALEF